VREVSRSTVGVVIQIENSSAESDRKKCGSDKEIRVEKISLRHVQAEV
jgi:hypothetical protein